MQLKLSPEEAELIREVLVDRHTELFREISRAQHRDFRVALKQKEALLDSTIVRLNALLEESCQESSDDLILR